MSRLRCYGMAWLLWAVLFALVLFLNGSAGYVYLSWFGWQLQTSIVMLCFFILLLLSCLGLCKHVLASRRQSTASSLGLAANQVIPEHDVLALLVTPLAALNRFANKTWSLADHAQREQFVQALQQTDLAGALQLSKTLSPQLQPWAEWLYLQVCMQQPAEQVQVHLRAAHKPSVSDLSVSLTQLWEQQWQRLWLDWSLQHSDLFLTLNQWIQLDNQALAHYLAQLQGLIQADDPVLHTILLAQHAEISQALQTRDLPIQNMWLNCMSRVLDLQEQSQCYAKQILTQQFSEDVFLIYFMLCLQDENVNMSALQAQLQHYSQYYSGLPVLYFAQAYMAILQQDLSAALAWRDKMPDHPLKAYLNLRLEMQEVCSISHLNSIMRLKYHYWSNK